MLPRTRTLLAGGFGTGPGLMGTRGLFLAGLIGSNVERRQGAAGPLDQPLDAELGLGQEPGATLVKRNASLVQGDRCLQWLAAGLERGDGSLQLRQGVVEGELFDRRVQVAARHAEPDPGTRRRLGRIADDQFVDGPADDRIASVQRRLRTERAEGRAG